MKIKNILFFVLFLILILFGFSNINKSTENLDIDRVKNSLDTALITCYSVEGRYPESVQYLRKNYGFTYDKNSKPAIAYENFCKEVLKNEKQRTRNETTYSR